MKTALTQFFFETILPLLLTALGGVAVWALAQLTLWLREKATTSKVARIGGVVADLAASIVAELNATLRPQLEAALKDGVLTDVEKTQLKTTALNILKTKLPAGTQALATSVFGAAVDTWLSGHVERAVVAANAASLPLTVPLIPAPTAAALSPSAP